MNNMKYITNELSPKINRYVQRVINIFKWNHHWIREREQKKVENAFVINWMARKEGIFSVICWYNRGVSFRRS